MNDRPETPRLDTPSRGVVEGPPHLPARPPTAQLLLKIVLPGEPHAQKRARAFRLGKFIRMHDAPESRSWKGDAQVHYREALRLEKLSAPAFTGPVALRIVAVFPLPAGKHRKREPFPARSFYSGAKDADNVAKAVQDAANGLLWLDDRQVKQLHVWMWTGAQGEAAHVEVTVLDLTPQVGLQAAHRRLALGGA